MKRSLEILVFTIFEIHFEGVMSIEDLSKRSVNAIVPYSESSILKEFHETHRTIRISNRQYEFTQKWNQNGVSGVLWDSVSLNLLTFQFQAIVLSKYLISHPHLITSRRVLELGAGLGLPSIIASEIGASAVDCTDQLFAVPLLRENIQRNTLTHAQTIHVFPLDWQIDKPKHKYQVILGADLVYNEKLFSSLKRIMRLSSDQSTLILFSSRIRYEKDKKFYESLKVEGLNVQEEFYDAPTDVRIYRIISSSSNDLVGDEL
ncbi:unnamed protein product [Anisakis simplex]|uniref:Methyltransferase-domain-containing protein n=1 Tax=Anisakis simplex TaxID=6269 RepID=A0A0M3K0L2_ANISI|nr:unnamed protein product [Anisakis simplex]